MRCRATSPALGPSHLVSLVAPGELPPTPAGIELERHLRVGIHDISEPLDGHVLPEAEHLSEADRVPARLVARGRAAAGPLRRRHQPLDGGALIALVVKAGGREREAAELVRQKAPHALPERADDRARRPRSWAARAA